MKMRKLILFLLAGLFLSSSVIACIEPMAAYSSRSDIQQANVSAWAISTVWEQMVPIF